MKSLGIIQPLKIGDIIICLPIAKHYSKLYDKVYWPVLKNYCQMFQNHVDYVEFIPVEYNYNVMNNARNLVKGSNILELAFNFSDTTESTNSFQRQNTKSFDEFKYTLGGVPFDEKWNLDIKRDYSREEELYQKLIKNPDYVVYQNRASDYVVNFNLNMGDHKYDIIELKDYTNDVFDWLTILERAKKLVLIESCFSNLVDQLHIKTDKILLLKHGYYGAKLDDGTLRGMPRLRENWETI